MQIALECLVWFGAILFSYFGFRGVCLAILFDRARKKAEFALDYGVWHRDNYGKELLIKYHDSLKVDMNHILGWRYWSMPGLIHDSYIPIWKHCNELEPIMVSNEHMLYLMRRLEWAEKAVKMGKTCTLQQKQGYEMGVSSNTFQNTMNQALEGIKDSENCIIDIFTQNGVSWKQQPKQPENRPIVPHKTDN